MVHYHSTLSLYTVTVHCPCTLSTMSLSTVTVHGTLLSGTVRCQCTLHTATVHCHYTLSLYIVTLHCTVHCTLYSVHFVHYTPQGLIECIPMHSVSATMTKTLH